MRFVSPVFALTLLLPAALFAATHQAVAKVYYRTFSHNNPVMLRIQPGDVVVTKTLDASGRDFTGAVRHPDPGNPLTGPFFVEGAQPGDALVVHLRKLRLNRNWGYSGYRLGLFSLTPESIEKLYPANYKPDVAIKGASRYVRWDLDLARNMAQLNDPKSRQIQLQFPAQPMLGCIGVAPAGDFSPTSGPAGSYGGNLDYNEVREGANVILPVYHPGAYFFLGDGHALQGDGEPTGNGIETSLDVEFSIDVRKSAHLSGPRVETPNYLISVGAQPEFVSALDRGLQMATVDMVHWLTSEYKLEPWAAHLLVAFQGKYDVVTVAGTMGLKIPKAALAKKP